MGKTFVAAVIGSNGRRNWPSTAKKLSESFRIIQVCLKRDKLDAGLSDYIRARDGWKCRCCGASQNPALDVLIQCAHIFTRANKGIRIDPDNAVALCKRCHCSFTFRKEEWSAWCEKKLGAGHMERLRRSEEHTSELQSPDHLVCRLLLEKKKKRKTKYNDVGQKANSWSRD